MGEFKSGFMISGSHKQYEEKSPLNYSDSVRDGKVEDIRVFPSAVALQPKKDLGLKSTESYAQDSVEQHVSAEVVGGLREQSKQKRCKILAVANQKGGVGKTTTTLTLGASLARMGKKVLLVDLDPHACTSIHLKLYPGEQTTTLYDLFALENGDFSELWKRLAIPVGIPGISAAPGHIRLSELEFDLRDRTNKGMILNESLHHVSDKYDYILLDCPPHVGILLVNALVACDLLIIPIQTDFLALHGLKLLFDTIRTLNKVLPEPVRYRALPTMFDRRARACRRVLDLMRHKMGNAMFDTVVGVDTRFREASAMGCSIYDIDPETQGARAYDYLAEEVMNLW